MDVADHGVVVRGLMASVVTDRPGKHTFYTRPK